MVDHLNAEIIAIGTEILLGEITDTNSVFIAKAFRDIGVNVFYMTSVGDNEDRISDAIRLALSRSNIVITCGGLGPTVDDMTRISVANATDRELEFHQELYDAIEKRFSIYRVKMTENNRRQAFLPQDSIPIDNPVGTAPCFIVEHENKAVISLPGVPREMKYLMKESVLPYLQKKYALGIIKARNLRTAGIGESTLDTLLGEELLEHANPSLGLAAHHGSVDIRITAKADDETLADEMLDEFEQQVRQQVGNFIFGVDSDELEPVLVNQLQAMNAKFALVEVGIEDAIMARIQAVDGGKERVSSFQSLSTLDALATDFDTALDLKELGMMVAKKTYDDTDSMASIVVLIDPNVDENSDREYASIVVVYTPEKASHRVYGFGAKNDLAKIWVSRWALSRLWRFLQEVASDVD